MRHGYFMGYGYNGASIFIVILVLIAVVLLLIAINSNKKVNPQTRVLLEILKERYVRDEISADEYRERSMIIEDDENFDSVAMNLKEQYVRGEIDSNEFCSKRNKVESGTVNKALYILNERYARGEISSDEYKKIKKEIS